MWPSQQKQNLDHHELQFAGKTKEERTLQNATKIGLWRQVEMSVWMCARVVFVWYMMYVWLLYVWLCVFVFDCVHLVAANFKHAQSNRNMDIDSRHTL